MKIKRILVVILSIIFLGDVAAQSIEITPYGGYMFGGKFRAYEGEANIGDNGSWGIAIDYGLSGGLYAEVMYNMQRSETSIQQYGFFDSEDLFDLTTHYFQVGVLQEMSQEAIRPFASFTTGATLFHPIDSNFDDLWRFSATLGLGAKAFLTDRIGIRLQARMLVPMFFAGGGVWCGPGGCSTNLVAATAIVQGDFTGGIIIRLGD